MAVETPSYAVVHAEEPFEVRHYDGTLTANVRVRANGHDSAVNQGFNYLADFIFGNNVASDRIAMTAPVTAAREPGTKIAMTAPVGVSRDADEFVVSFTMPAEFTEQTLPRANNPRVFIERVPDRFAATVRFSGYLDDEKRERYEAELRDWMARSGLEPCGEAIAAQYDAPWRPWFVRRNEIIIPVEAPPSGAFGS